MGWGEGGSQRPTSEKQLPTPIACLLSHLCLSPVSLSPVCLSPRLFQYISYFKLYFPPTYMPPTSIIIRSDFRLEAFFFIRILFKNHFALSLFLKFLFLRKFGILTTFITKADQTLVKNFGFKQLRSFSPKEKCAKIFLLLHFF